MIANDDFLSAIANRKFHQREIAEIYSNAIDHGCAIDWKKINQAIIKRWSIAGLNRIKQMAWNQRKPKRIVFILPTFRV